MPRVQMRNGESLDDGLLLAQERLDRALNSLTQLERQVREHQQHVAELEALRHATATTTLAQVFIGSLVGALVACLLFALTSLVLWSAP